MAYIRWPFYLLRPYMIIFNVFINESDKLLRGYTQRTYFICGISLWHGMICGKCIGIQKETCIIVKKHIPSCNGNNGYIHHENVMFYLLKLDSSFTKCHCLIVF